MISLKDCFKKELLKKISPSKDLAKKYLKKAEFFLKETQDLLEINKKHAAAILLYSAFFHASRALLYKDGIKERSHYCIARYIEENYINKKLIDEKFLNTFETVMSIKHNIQYSTEKVEIDEDLVELSNICEEFITVINKLLTR